MKRNPRQENRKPKEVTLIIDSKILEHKTHVPSPFNDTLRSPMSSLASLASPTSMTLNLTRQNPLMSKSSSNVDLESTLKRPSSRSNSKTDRSVKSSMHRTRSLSSMSPTSQSQLKVASFVSKQSNLKCFERLVFRVTDYFQPLQTCWNLNCLSYCNVLTLLHHLHYVQHPTEGELVENNLVETLKLAYQLWVNLTQRTSATLCNLLLLLCHIENIQVEYEHVEITMESFVTHLKNKGVRFQKQEEYLLEYRFVGAKVITQWTQDGQLVVNKGDSSRIQHAFKSLKINRLGYQYREPQMVEVERIPLSERSNRLAMTKRQKIEAIIRQRQPEIEKITLSDLLNFKEMTTSNPSLSARTYEENETSAMPKPSPRTPRLKIHRKPCPLIEMLSRPKLVQIHSKEELQFERNRKECTFKPTIKPLSVNKDKELFEIKNVVKTLERMKGGRRFKQEEKTKREKGWTNNNRAKSKQRGEGNALALTDRTETMDCQKKQDKDNEQNRQNRQKRQNKSNRQDRQDRQNKQNKWLQAPNNEYLQTKEGKSDLRIPLLFIDINIDETQKERLIIYEEDSSQQLAATFAKKHNLTKDMEHKLKDLLDFQMNSILTKIEEEAEDEELF